MFFRLGPLTELEKSLSMNQVIILWDFVQSILESKATLIDSMGFRVNSCCCVSYTFASLSSSLLMAVCNVWHVISLKEDLHRKIFFFFIKKKKTLNRYLAFTTSKCSSIFHYRLQICVGIFQIYEVWNNSNGKTLFRGFPIIPTIPVWETE